MADEIDIAQDRELQDTAKAIAAVRSRAEMPVGEAGECDWCGEESLRLVGGACAPCRDKRRLK